MTKRIEIRNLRSVKNLEFPIPAPGVYLLTGANGSGKTSLLTCLERIGNANAFQNSFRTSPHKSLDSFLKAEIGYHVDDDAVIYKYSGERWAPTPRRNSELLRNLGFSDVLHIAADGKRIEPRKEEFEPRRVRLAPSLLRDALNTILITTKFSELCYINLQRGTGNKAYLIRSRTPQGDPEYFSEKNFSLGELCVLKLVLSLDGCRNSSLLLIDELELALHPRAQIALFHYIERIASEKNLTVLLSTHSVSLIKAAKRKQILFLEASGNEIRCIVGCFPAHALGQLAFEEEVAPDVAIFVEDEQAKYSLDAMTQLFIETRLPGKPKPTIVISPIGGFVQVISFLNNAASILPPTTKSHAFLDADVKTESVQEFHNAGNHKMLQLFQSVEKKLSYFPWTPEVGFCEMIRLDIGGSEHRIRQFFGDNRIQLTGIGWSEIVNLQGGARRKRAKGLMGALADEIAQLRGEDPQLVKRRLQAYLVENTYRQNLGELYQLLGPVLG